MVSSRFPMPGLQTRLRPFGGEAIHGVQSISFQAVRQNEALRMDYHLLGNPEHIEMSLEPGGCRRDELWQTTCFEAFLRQDGAEGYIEFNFAPNGDWAAYQFDHYRSLPCDLEISAPVITCSVTSDGIVVSVSVSGLPTVYQAPNILLGPAVIIESQDKTRSYWALHHPLSKPDFHDAKNFKVRLE